ncbi:MAG: S49 family peptidase, partial [Candidatus Gottesmanbacteria bacterium]
MASTLSDVGSIGVTSSYIDYSKNNVDQGITFNQLSTGLYKDMFNEDKPLTDEERAIAERDLEITFNKFIDIVATNRSLDRDKVVALADGSSMLGEQALEVGLIDQIGGEDDALKYLENKTGPAAEVCWY